MVAARDMVSSVTISAFESTTCMIAFCCHAHRDCQKDKHERNNETTAHNRNNVEAITYHIPNESSSGGSKGEKFMVCWLAESSLACEEGLLRKILAE